MPQRRAAKKKKRVRQSSNSKVQSDAQATAASHEATDDNRVVRAAEEMRSQVHEWTEALGWKGALAGFVVVYAFVRSLFLADDGAAFQLLPRLARQQQQRRRRVVQLPPDNSYNVVLIGCAVCAFMLLSYIACAVVQLKTRSKKDAEDKFFRKMMVRSSFSC